MKNQRGTGEGTEITLTRVNWGGGGDHVRAVGTNNNNNNYHNKTDGRSGDREHAIPVASVATMATAAAPRRRSSRITSMLQQ